MKYEEAEIGKPSVPVAVDHYACWQHPFRGTRICMDPMPIQTLSTRALRSFKARRPSEVGGILWGKPAAQTEDRSIIITNAEFVRSDGPLYNSAPVDACNLVRALNTSRTEAGLSLLGYFRSHIREGLCLTPQDEELIGQHMRDPDSVFLIIRPFDIGICMAGFFFWRDGRLQSDASELEVPFVAPAEATARQNGRIARREIIIDSRAESDVPASFNRENLANNAVPREPTPQSSPSAGFQDSAKSAGTPSVTGKRKSGKTNESGERAPYLYVVTIGLALLLIIAVGVAAYFALPALQSRLQNVAEYTSKTGVGLRVLLAPDGQLDLSWNRSAPELVSAKGAKLTITDGPLYREVNIDNAQLRSGKLTYFPSSADVQFRLEIYLDNTRSLAEWVRVLSPGMNASRVDSRIATDSSVPTQLPMGRAHQAPLATTPPVEELDHRASKTPVFKMTSAVPLRKPPSLSGFREWMAPPNIPLEIEKNPASRLLSLLLDPALPIPAQLTAKIPDHGTNYGPRRTEYGIHQNANLGQSGSEPTAAMDRKTTEAAQAVPTDSLHTSPLKPTMMPTSRSAPDPSATDVYTPPRPIRKILPNTKLLGASINYGNLKIEVQVRIDRSGHVTEAHLLQNGKKVSSLLTGAAVAAAKQWIFEPATLRGTTVSADHTIVFEFRGPP